jgi:dissimilatory sulfite reductase (desulfoviridin) alpha/beta subunit
MKWTSEAENRIRKVPFFVRRKVRKQVEQEAVSSGDPVVDVVHLEACRQRYMSDKHHQTRGYEIDQCFGADECPNRAVEFGRIYTRMEDMLRDKRLERFLRETVAGPVKMHHAFRVSISGCPNCCSRPQIVDFGLAGASVVEVTDEECSHCGLCFSACRENGLHEDGETGRPILDEHMCLRCGDCAGVCTAGTLAVARRGFRIMLGGRLGRHPQFARELPGVWSHDEVLEILDRTVDHFKSDNRGGERLGDIINRTGLDFLDR